MRGPGERSPQPGPLDRMEGLFLTARDACGVGDVAVDSAHLSELLPGACESLHLGDHVCCPFVGVLKEHSAEALLALVSCASPAAPHSCAHLDRNSLGLLPSPTHGGVDHLSDGRDAPVIPVVSCNLVDPEESFSVPCIHVEAKGILDGFVVIVVV